MIWLFIIVMTVVLGAVISAGVFATKPACAKKVLGAIVAIAVFVVLGMLLWKYLIVALAIAAVCSLAVGVMFQKVDPSKAVGGAIAAFVLMFLFSWLALQLADPLLFNKESDLSRWLTNLCGSAQPYGRHDIGASGFLASLGVACLLAACFLDRWIRAIAVFLGALLVLFFTPVVLEEHGIIFRDFFYGHDPVFKLAIVGLIIVGLVAIVRLLTASRNSKHP